MRNFLKRIVSASTPPDTTAFPAHGPHSWFFLLHGNHRHSVHYVRLDDLAQQKPKAEFFVEETAFRALRCDV
jgi:hypothetical protein